MRYPFFILAAATFSLYFTACESKKSSGEYEVIDGITYYSGKKSNNLVYQISNDPETAALSQQQTASRKDIKSYIHAWLYYNQDDGTLIPGIAKGQMQVSPDGLSYTVDIHPDAKWEDATPITTQDVLFSLKVATCPLSDNNASANYLEFFKAFTEKSPKQFQIDMKSYYMLNNMFLCNFPIIDKRIYDPQHILDKYSLEQLQQPAAQLAKDATLQTWVKEFTDPKYGRDPKFLKGAGMYELASWKAGQEIVLKRKDNFWAKNMTGNYFAQYPDSITLKVVKEATAIEIGIKQEQLDMATTVTATAYKKMLQDPQVISNYVLREGSRFSFTMMAFNLSPNKKKQNPALDDILVRKAIAYLCPAQEIIDQLLEGFGDPIASPAYLKSSQYNQKLRPIPFLPAKADSLLATAGWKDTDGDKILDKMIKGKKTKLSLSLSYNIKSSVGEQIVRKVQAELQKAGFEANLDPLEQNRLMEKATTKDFDVAFMGFSPGSMVIDFKEMWGRSSSSNFSGFGTVETDKLIEQIRTTQDPTQFKTLSDSIQQIIYNQQPVVFLYNSRGRMIVHKRFNHADKLEFSQANLNTLEMRRK